MYLIENVSETICISCDLKDGSSLRLLPKSEVTIKENNMTDYIMSLSKMEKPILKISYNNESVKKAEKPKKEDKNKEDK